MKCYICKTDRLQKVMRVDIKSIRKPYDFKFRDLCFKCYENHMKEKGYILSEGVWIQKKSKEVHLPSVRG